MPKSLVDTVLGFFYKLFDAIFFDPVKDGIEDRFKRDEVHRQVEELAYSLKYAKTLRDGGLETVYRASLVSIAEILMLVGSALRQWEKLKFAK